MGEAGVAFTFTFGGVEATTVKFAVAFHVFVLRHDLFVGYFIRIKEKVKNEDVVYSSEAAVGIRQAEFFNAFKAKSFSGPVAVVIFDGRMDGWLRVKSHDTISTF